MHREKLKFSPNGEDSLQIEVEAYDVSYINLGVHYTDVYKIICTFPVVCIFFMVVFIFLFFFMTMMMLVFSSSSLVTMPINIIIFTFMITITTMYYNENTALIHKVATLYIKHWCQNSR